MQLVKDGMSYFCMSWAEGGGEEGIERQFQYCGVVQGRFKLQTGPSFVRQND